MNIRKKLAVLAAVALPLSGLAVLGGVQAASVGGPPVLTCPNVQPDPNPGTPGAGGTTFDNGGGPGSAGMYISANAGGAGVLAANASNGATSIKITTLAIAGETLTIAGGYGPFTVTGDSTTLGQPVSLGYPETADITPTLNGIPLVHGVGTLKAKITGVTVAPTSTTSNRTVNDGVLSGTDLQSATAAFTAGDVGQPVSGSHSGTSIFPGGGPPVTIATYNSATDVTLSSAATYGGGGATVTIGDDQFAPATVTGDFDFQASGCQAIPYALFQGVFTPTSATLTGQNAGIANSAIALEANPSALNLTATYPAIGAGWCDNGGAPSCATQPTTTIGFNSAKYNKFILLENSYTYAGGAAVGDYHTTKATFGLAANGMVACTVAQLQAITYGTGADAGSIPQGSSELQYCDGGTSSAITPAQALTNVINLELNPQTTIFGSDGATIAAIWAIDAGPQGNTVI